jgi:HK97 family phage prohead protease
VEHLPVTVDVVRAVGAAPQLRKATDDGLGLLSGHFSTFNNWYSVSSMWEGDFLERTAPGFTKQTIAEDRTGMRVLFNHGFDTMAGDKVLGPIQDLREDKTGAYYEVPLFDTSYNRDLLPGLKAGVYGASFRMKVQEDSWNDAPDTSDYNPKGLPERTITRAKVMEFGPVTFPANPGATAGMRSMTDHYYEQLKRRDQQAYDTAVRAAGRLPLADLTRATDATIEELVAAADALVDEVEEALEAGDTAQATALLTALDETIDSQMVLLGLPDTDEADNGGPLAMLSAQPRRAGGRPERVLTAAQTKAITINAPNYTGDPAELARALKDIAGRPGARSAGGGDSKDARPGEGTAAPNPQAQRFEEMLKLSKMKLPKPTTPLPERDTKHG